MKYGQKVIRGSGYGRRDTGTWNFAPHTVSRSPKHIAERSPEQTTEHHAHTSPFESVARSAAIRACASFRSWRTFAALGW